MFGISKLFRTGKHVSGKSARRVRPLSLEVEALENRQLMSISQVGQTIMIDGTAANDVARVAELRIQTVYGSRLLGYSVSQTNDQGLSESRFFHAGQVNAIQFSGHAGNDSFTNKTGLASTAFGGDGNDTLIGGSKADQLYGEENGSGMSSLTGNDSIVGGAGNDTVRGENGNDTIRGGTGNDNLNGNRDDDFILGEAGDNTVEGGNGNDLLYGDFNNALTFFNDGNDVILGKRGNDTIYGGAGADTIFGDDDGTQTGGMGVEPAATSKDLIFGELGNDTISGGQGNDTMDGGAGNDLMYGNFAGNTLAQNPLDDHDSMMGGEGDDTLMGGIGNDTLIGGLGTDRLEGQEGNDHLNGGDVGTVKDGKMDVLLGQVGTDTFDAEYRTLYIPPFYNPFTHKTTPGYKVSLPLDSTDFNVADGDMLIKYT